MQKQGGTYEPAGDTTSNLVDDVASFWEEVKAYVS